MDYLLIFLGVMIFLFAVGVPVAISIGLTCLVVLVAQGGINQIPEELFAMQMLSGMNNFPIIAVPFFILAASLMNTGSSNRADIQLRYGTRRADPGRAGACERASQRDLCRHVGHGGGGCGGNRPA